MHAPVLSYRGRAVYLDDVAAIGQLIAAHPQASRRGLSILLCEAWNWRQANGAVRDMVCRGLLLALYRAGQIELPAARRVCVCASRRNRPVLPEGTLDQEPLSAPLPELLPLEIRQVRRSADEALFNGLIERFHYLGYRPCVGEHLKHMVWTRQGRVIACLAWSSAPWHIGVRDRFIGWTPAVRRRQLHLLAYNTRFLVLPWVRVPHLASHILGRVARRISADWEHLYNHPIHYLETFVDRELFKGTCYRAANWICLGQTTGRGIKEKTKKVTRSLKDVLGYPLAKDFRRRLGVGAP